MSLSVYTIEDSVEWDRVVRSFNDYDIYWLSGYVKSFEIHGDGDPLLFHYEDSYTRGINVVMKRDISKDKKFSGELPENQYFDFSTPYGYGGWLIEGDETEKLFMAYEKWCKNHGVLSEFVRFHPVKQNQKKSNIFYSIVELGNTVVLELSSPESIWENLIGKNRNMIRKAKKNGIKVFMGHYPDIFEIFREIYNQTMLRDSANDYYYFKKNFYESILNDLPYNSQIFYAMYEEEIIAASIVLISNKCMNYHFSGSIKKYSSLAPTNLILYEAAIWGYEIGCKSFYLGGGLGSNEDSLYKFKKSFNKNDEIHRFCIGKKIFNQEDYEKLSEMRNNSNVKIVENDFFPIYRG